MNELSIKRTYNRYSNVYDMLFGRVFSHGRKKIIKELELKGGEHILEIGIGTGISLNMYPPSVQIIGIDLSEKMIEKARYKIDKYKLNNIELKVENAEKVTYEKNSFDKVVIMYVLSVTPNPEQLLKKALEVCKENGEVMIVNHFTKNKSFSQFIKHSFRNKVEKMVGFRFHFPLEEYLLQLRRAGKVEVKIKSANYGLSKVIQIKKLYT